MSKIFSTDKDVSNILRLRKSTDENQQQNNKIKNHEIA